MISAKQARDKSNENRDAEVAIEIGKTERAINSAIASGKRNCTIYENISNGVLSKLRELGYEVKTFDSQREGCSVTINW